MTSRPRTSRRRWSETFKKRVVSEASEPGVTVEQIAHRYDLDARRISNWNSKLGSRTLTNNHCTGTAVQLVTWKALFRGRAPSIAVPCVCWRIGQNELKHRELLQPAHA
jgi:transposase-like protein